MKYFTLSEARKTLPLIRKIVNDILKSGQELKLLAATLQDSTESNQLFNEIKNNLINYINELESLGCFYKDWNFEYGLVDFPSKIDEQTVLLCWRSDEPDIFFYHSLEEGYSGRKPIPEDVV